MKTVEDVIEEIKKYQRNILSALCKDSRVQNKQYYRNPVEKYCAIKKEFETWNGDINSDFCADFIDFYRVKLFMEKKEKNDMFQIIYFNLFKETKEKKETDFYRVFEELKSRLNGITKKVNQTSFVSKLIHTLNNDSAIYDSNVKKALGLYGDKCLPEIQAFIDKNRSTLEPIVNEIISEVILQCDINIVKNIEISYTKKADFVLWQLGGHLKKNQSK